MWLFTGSGVANCLTGGCWRRADRNRRAVARLRGVDRIRNQRKRFAHREDELVHFSEGVRCVDKKWTVCYNL
jgi:hypothetical protein